MNMKSVGRFAVLASGPAVFAAGSPEKPNMVFVLCDDMGWGDLGCFGNSDVRTPRIDELARTGLRLNSFYVNAPVCSPSRAALLTGRFPSELGMHYVLSHQREFNDSHQTVGWLDDSLPTVYDAFKAAGYTTGHYGKWHLGAAHQPEYSQDAPPPSEYGVMFSGTMHSTGAPVEKPGEVYNNTTRSDIVFKRGIEFINEHKNEPFFLSIWTQDPHGVLDPRQEYIDEYGAFKPDEVGDKWPGGMAIYYAAVSNIDRQFAKFMDELEKLGLSDNTIIVFTSDNGPATMYAKSVSHAGAGSAGPFRGVKGTLYEGGIRMPFIIKWPGRIPSGAVDDQSVVTGADMPLSLAKLAGVPVTGLTGMNGEDRSEVLLGKPSARTKPVFWDFRGPRNAISTQCSPHLALRDGDWKLLMNLDGSRQELYNLRNDPSESSDRAALEPTRVKAMSEALLAWGRSLPHNDKISPERGKDTWPMPGKITIESVRQSRQNNRGEE